ncbi:Fanconi anemia group A protein isoform X2 [Sceloporus undulatus]|uniref:Fanconi anemia group A protein isoform X2 n=1 Tax=Sceloporus undulatus TaxID=8520 RepID=UPI001C4B71A2|nr:Fanconi anemia group A protein isoform X2 [Sceloporus undulatus]
MAGREAECPRGRLSALLGRSKKQKCGRRNGQKLQEKALRILSCHQNLGDLLQEVGSPVGKKAFVPSNSGTDGRETSVPDLFVVSALQDQAAALGVPVGILSAQTAARNVEKISAESGHAMLLKGEQRKKLSCLLHTLKDLSTQNAFSHLQFAQEMWKMQSPLTLDIAWQLHREGLVSLEELLENNPDAPTLVDWLCNSLRLLCHHLESPSLETEPLGTILTDFAAVFLRHRFQKMYEPVKKLELQNLSKICRDVLERMLAWVLDSVAKEKQEDASTLKAVKRWLCVFTVTAYQGTIHPESLREFFSHTLAQVLTYNPQLKVSDAICLQKEWSFARTNTVLTLLYRKLFVLFKAEELIHHLQQVLEASEVNWHHILSCVSTLLICHSEAESLIKDFLGQLLKNAFQNYDLENMMTAFLITRQAALEGPAIFMPYSEWFKVAFGSASGFHSSTKKALIFLFKFLSELVPFEAPQYLKVHIMHPPFVPSKYRPLLLEYIALAKTRLTDFKVSIEDMGLYEDLSSPKEAVQPHHQAIQDVEKAVQIFENTGKIPATVMEASIFRQSYYTTRFIPALLVPRVLPETPDSRMALIDSLKRVEKIPPNMYATYIEECQAAKEKLLQEESAEMETSHPKEPLELLRAELEVLRLLITDQHKQEELPAQIAHISEKLAGVLGHMKDEDEAASMNLRIQLNLSIPEVQRQHQEVVDLLLTSFCKNVMSVSYFLPPERQGAWASLFVKMICGHRQILPSLLSRLCQLIYHQGSSLSDAHIIGLAVFAVHLNEAKLFIPAIDICSSLVPFSTAVRELSVTELWDYFLVCQTGESFIFCMKFCTATLSYFLCKFASLPHDHFCTLLPPGFVKKLQYVVPRLCVEARDTGWEGNTDDLPWETLSHLNFCYSKAALCLWKQPHFKELLQEKVFQLALQEWLLMELGIHPDEDILSAAERQEFHYWALYQHYLPLPATAGGCDGDLQMACAVLIDTILDFCQRSELGKCNHPNNPKFSISQRRGNPEIYSRLQEMLLELELERRRASPAICGKEEHFLFQIFQERLKALGNGTAVREKMHRQQELILQTRILLGLPPSILIATRRKGKEVVLDCKDFFCFINTELKNICSRGSTLSYHLTAHFFRGLLSASLECGKPAREVTAIFTLCQSRCPIILCSAARWWSRLEPVLCSEWKRLFDTPLAQGLQSLRELQASVNSFLSLESSSLVADIPWLSAAFLHFTVQQQMVSEKLGEVLERLGPGTEQVLVSLLFFLVMDFISTRVAPQEGVDAQKAIDWAAKVLQRLQEQGVCWLSVFSLTGPAQSPDQILCGAVSDQHLKLLPIAFYSLLFTFDSDHLTREPQFLHVAVDMYAQLLQLFMNGTTEVGPSLREQRPCTRDPEESLVLIRGAHQFLLRAIHQCPQGSFSNLQQLLDLCATLDPEIKAALVDFSTEGDLLDEEPLLF